MSENVPTCRHAELSFQSSPIAGWRRDGRTVNSVNAPTSLSTVIVASLQHFRIGAKSRIFGAPSQDLLASVN